jgi:hypothetical protein
VSARVEVLPGRGSVIRYGELTVWAGVGVSAELISFLQQSARNVAASTSSGRQVVDHIAGILATRDPERNAPFAVIGPVEGGWIVLLHGPVQAWDGTRWLAPTPDPGWLQAQVEPRPAVSVGPAGGPSPRLVVASPYDLVAGMVPGGGVIVLPGAGQPPPRPSPEPATSSGAPHDFGHAAWAGAPPSSGQSAAPPVADFPPVVDRSPAALPSPPPGGFTPPGGLSPSAGGFTPPGAASPYAGGVSPSGAPSPSPAGAALSAGAAAGGPNPAAARRPASLRPEVNQVPSGPTPPVVDLRNRNHPTEPPLPAGFRLPPGDRPEIGGIRCPRHHFNRPGMATCAYCRLPIPPGQPQVPGPRPALGVLLADDGTVYRVARDLLIGANPAVDMAVTGGTLQPLTLASAPGLLAPAHTELRLHGWTLRAIDRGSASGTFSVATGASDWVKLDPYTAVDVTPGSHLSLGQRVLTYLSPWR